MLPTPTLESLRMQCEQLLSLVEKHHAFNLRIFGSVARHEARPDSDVDFLVSFREGATIWDAVGLWQDLQDFLEREVSLVGEDDRPTRFMQRILQEAVPL